MATNRAQASSRRPLPSGVYLVRFPATSDSPDRFLYDASGSTTKDVRLAHRFPNWLSAKLAVQASYSTLDAFVDAAISGEFVIEDFVQPSLDLVSAHPQDVGHSNALHQSHDGTF